MASRVGNILTWAVTVIALLCAAPVASAKECFANLAETTLASAMTNVQTTMTVTTLTNFPTDVTCQLRVRVDNEFLLVTAGFTTTTWTVTRGVEGSAACLELHAKEGEVFDWTSATPRCVLPAGAAK